MFAALAIGRNGGVDCGDENASWVNDYGCCQRTCDTLTAQDCRIQCLRAESGCLCNEGYARSTPLGPCVPVTECKSLGRHLKKFEQRFIGVIL